MESLGDVRITAIPCLLAAGLLQYVHFAKKPMAFPCHRLTERASKHCAMAGMAAELLALRLLPLCAIYPMNASSLVFLYYWKESKQRKSSASPYNAAALSAAALSAWLLPYVAGPADGQAPRVMHLSELFDAILGRDTCIYVVGLLTAGVAAHCWLKGRPGGSVLRSCAPAALNFGVSAMLLKALAELAVSLLRSPDRPILWASLVVVLSLLLAVRSAAAAPLRKAIEVHDHLSVLAAYGLLSSAAASVTGGVVYREHSSWSSGQQVSYLAIAAVHSWGMYSLCLLGTDAKSYASVSKDSGKVDSPDYAEPSSQQGNGGKRNVVQGSGQTVEMVGLAAGAASPVFRISEPLAGSSSAVQDTAFSLPAPSFDADFSWGFQEDDKAHAAGAPGHVTDIAKPIPGVSVPSSVLTATSLDTGELDCSPIGQDDEDELLRSIEDIDLP